MSRWCEENSRRFSLVEHVHRGPCHDFAHLQYRRASTSCLVHQHNPKKVGSTAWFIVSSKPFLWVYQYIICIHMLCRSKHILQNVCAQILWFPRNHSWTFCRGDTSANGGRSVTMLAKDFQTVLIPFKSQHVPNPFSEKEKKTKLVDGFNPFEKY